MRLPQAVQQRIVVLAYTRPAVELIAGLRIADSERVVPPRLLVNEPVLAHRPTPRTSRNPRAPPGYGRAYYGG